MDCAPVDGVGLQYLRDKRGIRDPGAEPSDELPIHPGETWTLCRAHGKRRERAGSQGLRRTDLRRSDTTFPHARLQPNTVPHPMQGCDPVVVRPEPHGVKTCLREEWMQCVLSSPHFTSIMHTVWALTWRPEAHVARCFY